MAKWYKIFCKLYELPLLEIHSKQDLILQKLDDIMATLQEMNDALAEIDAETSRIGDYIDSILVQLNRTDLTEAQEATLLADLRLAAGRLKVIGKVNDPVPVDPVLPPVVP